MRAVVAHPRKLDTAVTPSLRTRHTELLRLCARIGYSPPASL
nr:capsid protein [Mesorhizobium loti]